MPVETLQPLELLTTTPIREGSSKNDEHNGFFSSILSAAQNAATIILPKPDDEETKRRLKFNLDISPYQSQQDLSQSLTKSATPVTTGSGYQSSSQNHSQSLILTSTVHFALVRDSPVNTLGDGDLTLLHFDLKLAGKEAGKVPAIYVEHSAIEETNKVLRKDDTEQTVTRDRSTSKATIEGLSDDDTRENDEVALAELEHMLDSASLTEASSKKNREFHSAFRSVPSSERLIGDYSCALSKDILVQGKLYLSQNFLFFKSNILGWVTNLQIPLQEVIQIEKKSTAVLFPNGIVIRTLHQKYVFASFMSRDTTFTLITKVWHNVLQNSVNDDPNTKQKAAVISRGRLRSVKSNDKNNAFSSGESSEEEDGLDSMVATDSDSDVEDRLLSDEEPMTRNEVSSKDQDEETGQSDEVSTLEGNDKEEGARKNSVNRKGSCKFGGITNPGPSTHDPTSIGYSKDSNDVVIIDHVFKAPLGVIFTILFGADNSYFIKILKAQKNFDIESSKITGLSEGQDERKYTYIKPLNGPIGPKQTICIVTDTLKECDFSKAVQVEQKTSSPDVPSGNSFKVFTKFFFSWDEDNSTRMLVTTSVEWSARSWIKGPVEKGSIDGQKDFMKGLVTIVTDIISSGDSGEKSKNKRKKSRSISRNPSTKKEPTAEPVPEPSILEKISGLLEDIGNLMPSRIRFCESTIIGALTCVCACICYSLLIMWLFSGGSKKGLIQADSEDVDVKVIYINNQKFYLQPSLDTYLHNGKRRAMSEMRLWNLINDNSHDMKDDNEVVNAYTDQEFSEVLKLARDRMEQVYKKLDI